MVIDGIKRMREFMMRYEVVMEGGGEVWREGLISRVD